MKLKENLNRIEKERNEKKRLKQGSNNLFPSHGFISRMTSEWFLALTRLFGVDPKKYLSKIIHVLCIIRWIPNTKPNVRDPCPREQL